MIAVTEYENKCPIKSGEIRKLKLKLSLYHLQKFLFFMVVYSDMWYIEHNSVNNDENIAILLLSRKKKN